MPYVNDLQSLADIVSPAAAAGQAGIQNEQADTEQAIKNQVAQGTEAAEIQKPGLANALTQAQTYAEQGLGMQQNAKGLVDMYGAPSAAQASVAGNQAKMTADQAQKVGSLGTLAGQVAGYMDQVPAPARPAAMQQFLQSNNIDPAQLGPLAQGDPDMLRSFSKNAIQASQSYQVEQLHSQTQENVAGTEATGHVEAANVTANARRYAADQQLKIKELNQNIDQSIATLGRKIAAAGARADPNDIALMRVLQQQQISARQMGAANTAYLVGQGNIVQAPTFTPSGAGQGPVPQQGNQPPGNAPQGGGNSLEDVMRARGLLK